MSSQFKTTKEIGEEYLNFKITFPNAICNFEKKWFSESVVKEAIEKHTRTGAPFIDKKGFLKELGLDG
jgi:hypothetical protein